MEKIYNTTVTELHVIFRQALIALIPSAERAQISWKDESAYDDWDNIARCLYENIVINSLRYASAYTEVDLPEYDLYNRARTNDFILVEGPGIPESAVFVAFGAVSGEFEDVKWVKALQSGEAVNQKVQHSPYNEACKFFWVRKVGSELERIDKLAVTL